MKALGVLFKLTTNCNFRCRHCYGDFGPGGRTMSSADVERVINHLSGETKRITFTGGEVSTRKDELFHAIAYAHAQKPILFTNAIVAVETNGSWIGDEESTYTFVEQLYRLGADELILAGIDHFHYEQGLNWDLQNATIGSLGKALSRLNGNSSRQPLEVKWNGAEGGVLPFGRGATLPISEHHKDPRCLLPLTFSSRYPSMTEVAISSDGRVYPCCWEIGPHIGSALEEPVLNLIQKAMKTDSLVSTMINYGVFAAAEKVGLPIPSDIAKEDESSCIACNRIFTEARKEGIVI